MGDSSQVLPLYDHPRGLATVTYQKGEQSLQTVVSLFNKIKRALLNKDHAPPPPGPRFLTMSYNAWLVVFGMVPFFCMVFAFRKLLGDPKGFTICRVLYVIVMLGGSIIHVVVLHCVTYWYRDMPFQLIGAKAKFMIEVIPMITVAILHHLLEFNYAYIAVLISIGCTGYFYIYAHFMHVAYDIGGIDALLGLVMQVLGYMLNLKLLVGSFILSFCLCFSFYRYVTYCAPEVPDHPKKELEQLPC
ncbi:hypothetical protein RND71_022401 [Anisodus tanguticus]|uniref:Uncharacterized protein n=1 Tax=Anisodus tanguticus TaxID=243964 RepID=A0AAE1RRZ8_9SOLA|nr:hypothetical protein RND71_022401 [Anisodus tanguticus]